MYHNIKTSKYHCDFLPRTFALPYDLKAFENVFKRYFFLYLLIDREGGWWILKPRAKSRAVGIQVINHLSQLPSFQTQSVFLVPSLIFRLSHVVSRYIKSPLLIDGRKFDLRLYVLVRSWNPMQAFLYIFYC